MFRGKEEKKIEEEEKYRRRKVKERTDSTEGHLKVKEEREERGVHDLSSLPHSPPPPEKP